MPWATQGLIEYPASGLVMADTGAIVAGITTRFTLLLWGDTDASFDVAVRNATNDADVSMQRLRLDSASYFLNEIPITLMVNQRLVIRAGRDMSGAFQGAILW